MAEITVTVNSAANGAGETTHTQTHQITGLITGIKLVRHTSANVATKIKVEEVGGLGRTICEVTMNTTPKTVYPTTPISDSAGTDISDQYRPVFLNCTAIKVSVTAAGAALTAAGVATIMTLD